MGYPTAVFPSDMRKPQGGHMKRGKVYMLIASLPCLIAQRIPMCFPT